MIAVLPSVQVVLIPRAIASGGLWAYGAVVAFAAVFPMVKLRESLSVHIQMKERFTYMREFGHHLSLPRFSPLTPQQLDAIQQVRDAIPFNIAWQSTSVLVICEAFIGASLLFLTLASHNFLVACMVIVIAVPEFCGTIISARAENRVWPAQSELSRRQDYVENLTIQAGPNFQMSLSGSMTNVGKKLAEYIGQLSKLWHSVTALRVYVSAATGIISSIGFLLAAYVLSAKTYAPAGDTFGVLAGLYSAMLSTSGAGRAYGELLSSAKPITTWMKLIRDLPPRSQANAVYSYKEIKTRPYAATPFTLTVHELDLHPGETVCLWGPNGSGKTTLLQYIATMCGGAASYLSQEFVHFEFTVREFLQITGADCGDTEMLHALSLVGLENRLTLDTQLGEGWGGTGLSGGQWQRLAIARTLMEKKPIVLLDEPTSSVDADTERILVPLVKRELPDSAIIIVTHRPEVRDQCDKTIHITGGLVA